MSLNDGAPTMTMPVAPTGMTGGGWGGFGGDNGWWFIILFLAIFCGWGGNGNGFGNNGSERNRKNRDFLNRNHLFVSCAAFRTDAGTCIDLRSARAADHLPVRRVTVRAELLPFRELCPASWALHNIFIFSHQCGTPYMVCKQLHITT